MPTLGELAALLHGTVAGPADLQVDGVAPLDLAGPTHLTFVLEPKYLPRLASTKAGAVLLGAGQDAAGKPAVVVADPRAALPALLARFAPEPPADGGPAADPTARVHPTAVLGEGVRVGAYAVIGAQVRIGARTEIGPLAVIGWGAVIGEDGRLAPQVVVGERCQVGARVVIHAGAVLGADGFGFVPGADGHVKIPQIGRVVVGDDVEIGANATVDRGTVGDTEIRRGAKLDDQVHVAHNCVVGEHAIIAGQAGLSGSVRVGRGCLIGGQVGVADHVTIGDGAQIGAQSGVHRDVPAGERVFGYPARPAVEAMRLNAEIARLPKLLERVRDLERRLAELVKKAGGA